MMILFSAKDLVSKMYMYKSNNGSAHFSRVNVFFFFVFFF